MNVVFLTDTSARNVKVGDKYTIQFKQTAPKNLAFTSEEAMLVIFALREIRQEDSNFGKEIARCPLSSGKVDM